MAEEYEQEEISLEELTFGLQEIPTEDASKEDAKDKDRSPGPGESAESGARESASEAERSDEDQGEKKERKKRDPFKDEPRTYSRDAALSEKKLTSLSQIKQIKKARVRHEGKRVVTDDVNKLKSLSIEPRLPAGEFINYYVEPVRIEYYIPRESRFSVETKYLYIPLIDPEPRDQDSILRTYISEDRFFDLIDVMNEHPRHITSILESYHGSMKLYEALSNAVRDAALDEERYKAAFYLCETLIEYEPSLAAAEFLGDFLSWNLNWLVRAMNRRGMEFLASDKTTSYFIKMRNIWWEERDYDYDERFEILAALFFEQAYPNRGMSYEGDEELYKNV